MLLEVTLSLVLPLTLPGSTAPLVFPLDDGPHAVGFRLLMQYDYTRSYRRVDAIGAPTSRPGRPIQTLIWYPAVAGTGMPLRYGDYTLLQAIEEDSGPPTDSARRQANLLLRYLARGKSDAEHAALAATPVRARQDAEPASGRFPVVVYAPSFDGVAFENSELCEYLASHGYIVVSSPDMGRTWRNMTADVSGAETQSRDILFLVGFMRDYPNADWSRVSVAGFSMGGLSNVLAALQNDRIRALVSLDGTVRYHFELLRGWHDWDQSRLRIPVLYLASNLGSVEEFAPFAARAVIGGKSFFGELTSADTWLITFPRMEHLDFGSHYLQTLPRGDDSEYSVDEVVESYVWMARYVRAFLDAFLKGDPDARAFVDRPPRENGVPPHLLFVEPRKATRRFGGGVDEFVPLVAERGFDHLEDAYAEMKKLDPDYTLPEWQVDGWGYELLGLGRSEDAIRVLRFSTTLYPESAYAFDSLGEAFLAAGDREQAVANYRKALALDPSLILAKASLKALGVDP